MEGSVLNVEIEKFNCTSCGAELNYNPGTTYLTCQYCNASNEIPVSNETIEELDFQTYVHGVIKKEDQTTETYVKCGSCGASETIDPQLTAANCVYCGTSLVLESASDEEIIQPNSLLPFKLNKNEGREAFKKWINSFWFAPNKLKKASLNFEHFKGVYVPYWTFDTQTYSLYTGQQGTHYYVSETYTDNGQTKSRQVRKTSWSMVSGNVSVNFDDILVVATQSLSPEHIQKLEPWDLPNLVPYDKSYVSGFISEKYQVDLATGFSKAKDYADRDIRVAVNRDIGGDEQRILSLQTRHDNVTFKHILLPVYVSAYRYKNKLYQFLVNARTGEVQGERPWSWIKIAGAILLVIVLIGAIILAMQ
jgi:LSD1 subclass zinc finger protein